MPRHYDFDGIVRDEETMEDFCKWFWTGKNSNNLIELLNMSEYRSTDYVRKERFRPFIYGVVLNYEFDTNWRFMKIGFTMSETTKRNSRMTKVERKIDKIYGEGMAKTIFVLAIDPVDTRSCKEVEVYVRKQIGYRINRDLAKTLSFPFKTEWVMTTQAFIDKIRKKIDVAKRARNANTSVFNGLNFVPKTDIPECIDSPKEVTGGYNRLIIYTRRKKICLEEAQTKKHHKIVKIKAFRYSC
ncbi:hypothetical protein ACJMK2_003897 [Sinanodonta woodiana]|uniref:GIY-YIG homing endonuclease n=1 Tax=Sinanodonta woodiana TaxID=1069815 RepID=A0ABD3Y1I0_SINWO